MKPHPQILQPVSPKDTDSLLQNPCGVHLHDNTFESQDPHLGSPTSRHLESIPFGVIFFKKMDETIVMSLLNGPAPLLVFIENGYFRLLFSSFKTLLGAYWVLRMPDQPRVG